MLAHGNHEVNAVNYYSQFAMPGDQENFGFDYGHAHLTVANDTPDNLSAIAGSTRDAIEADFEASKNARWKLLMHHQPIWSSATRTARTSRCSRRGCRSSTSTSSISCSTATITSTRSASRS